MFYQFRNNTVRAVYRDHSKPGRPPAARTMGPWESAPYKTIQHSLISCQRCFLCSVFVGKPAVEGNISVFSLLRRHSLWYSDHRRLSPGDGRPGEAALLHSNLEMTSTKCVGKNFQPDKATNTRREHVRHHVDMITAQATRNASVSTHDLVLKH